MNSASEPEKTPQPEPQDSGELVTTAENSIYIYVDKPGDTTVRPRRPEIPRFWPPDYPPPGSPDLPPQYR